MPRDHLAGFTPEQIKRLYGVLTGKIATCGECGGVLSDDGTCREGCVMATDHNAEPAVMASGDFMPTCDVCGVAVTQQTGVLTADGTYWCLDHVPF